MQAHFALYYVRSSGVDTPSFVRNRSSPQSYCFSPRDVRELRCHCIIELGCIPMLPNNSDSDKDDESGAED
jgi:hypothetical protein